MLRLPTCLASLALFLALNAHAGPAYQYLRIGSPQDAVTTPDAGYALMGGGTDLDEAFRWLCSRARGGDFLILRATGSGAYNPYIHGLEDGAGCRLNSVATLILPTRESANDPFVAQTIRNAEAIFLAGGDQANYTRNWTGTPVQRELNAAIARGVPIGGTSAGLAVLGEWAYSAEGDKPLNGKDVPNLDAKTALADPLGPRITLAHNFLAIPILKGVITDSHFVKRDRIGRLLAFLAHIESSTGKAGIRGIGIDERTAILLDPDGSASVIGTGAIYFIEPLPPIPILTPGKPLHQAAFRSQKISPGETFDLRKWCCGKGSDKLLVEDGTLRQLQDKGPVY